MRTHDGVDGLAGVDNMRARCRVLTNGMPCRWDSHEVTHFTISMPEPLHDRCVVRGVTLVDPRGCRPTLSFPLSSVVLYGRNGAGKSTLLRHVAEVLSGSALEGAESGDLVHVDGVGSLDGSGGLGLWIARAAHGHAERMARDDELGLPVPDESVVGSVSYMLQAEGASSELAKVIASQNRWVVEPDADQSFLEVAVAFDGHPLLEKVRAAVGARLPPPSSDEPHPASLGGRYERRWPIPDELRPLARGRLLDALVAAAVATLRDPQSADWACWPLVPVSADGSHARGEIPRAALQACAALVSEQGVSLAIAGLSAEVMSHLASTPVLVHNGRVEVEGELARLLEDTAARATGLLRRCLPNGPELRLRIAPPGSGPDLVLVSALDGVSGHDVSFSALSNAEQRWAALALQVAVLERTGRTSLGMLVLDEPEAGLHPLARRDVARGLATWVSELGVRIMLASHAAEFLDLDVADLWHVERDSDMASIRPLPREHLLAFTNGDHGRALGLTPAEALNLVRVFVIVEGAHDEVLLKAWLGDALDRARAHVVIMRGTRNLNSVIDCQVLLDYSEAKVVVVLDRTRAELEEVWREVARAKPARRADVLSRRRRHLEQARQLSEEEMKLFELFQAAARRAPQRLSFFGLTAPDVLQYLPPDALGMPPEATWPQLVQEWNHRGDFKAWLRQRGADISVRRLRRSAPDVLVPEEFERLARVIEALADEPLYPPTAWTDNEL